MGRHRDDHHGKLDPRPAVLVVEDQRLIRAVIAEFLRDCGFRVIEAGGARQAVQILQTEGPIDAVLADIEMPGSMDGVGLARSVRRQRPDLKVVLASGEADIAEAAGDLCDGGPLLRKPYDPQELERRMRHVLAQQDVCNRSR